jgi:hypothetical protein
MLEIHADRLASSSFKGPVGLDAVFHTCQFLATMLTWDVGETTLPKPLVEHVVKKLMKWEKEFVNAPEMDTIPRALGLIRQQPTWVHFARKVKAQMEKQLLGCNKLGCAVPYVPDQDKLQQCSKCKAARYVSTKGCLLTLKSRGMIDHLSSNIVLSATSATACRFSPYRSFSLFLLISNSGIHTR